jgi:regulator of nucleoside diphosphate kinase
MNTRRGYARQDERKAELRPPIVLTTADRDKLLALIRELPVSRALELPNSLRRKSSAQTLRRVMFRRLRSSMGSDVKFIDHDDGHIHRVKLVFLKEARGTRSISVLSSVGSALIGLSPGQSICWTEPGGKRSLTVLEVYSGDCVPCPHRRRG